MIKLSFSFTILKFFPVIFSGSPISLSVWFLLFYNYKGNLRAVQSSNYTRLFFHTFIAWILVWFRGVHTIVLHWYVVH